MAAVTTSASLQAVTVGFGSQIGGKCLTAACRTPSALRVARLVLRAKQGEVNSQPLTSAVKSVWTNVLGEKSRSKLEAFAFMAVNALLAMPALAEEEKGAIFDFNLTLPIITVQFLLLMVALDNIWFKPLSEVMDSRDDEIRKKLIGVRDNSAELNALQSEAEAVIRAARVETTNQVNKVKKELAAELDAKLQIYRASIEKELEAALANLQAQKEETIKNLDAQVSALSEEIIDKLIPSEV